MIFEYVVHILETFYYILNMNNNKPKNSIERCFRDDD